MQEIPQPCIKARRSFCSSEINGQKKGWPKVSPIPNSINTLGEDISDKDRGNNTVILIADSSMSLISDIDCQVRAMSGNKSYKVTDPLNDDDNLKLNFSQSDTEDKSNETKNTVNRDKTSSYYTLFV